MKRNLLLALSLIPLFGLSQDLIQSGPMKGYTEMRESLIWVQMTEPSLVELVYWPDTMPENEMRSSPVAAEKSKGYTVHLIADEVEPGTNYGYDIYANGVNQTEDRDLSFSTQALWQYRTDPPNFSIAIGSCAYVNEAAYDRPGKAYGRSYKIFETIEEQNPEMMLWLGDNIYLREADWFTQTGINKRYTHSRSIPELQNLLATANHYAIWDDHDYGPNDATRVFPKRDLTLEAFKNFWGNNGYGVNGLGGITSAFEFGDAHFFLLDNRWNRTDKNMATANEQMLGKDQIDWLIELLKYSKAPFKFVAVGSQILNTAKVYENYANYEEERAELLNRISAEKIEGVIFLTGDRHHSEMSEVEINGIKMYDLTISPLTSGTHNPGDEPNKNRIDGSLFFENNFGILELSGAFRDRTLLIKMIDDSGKEVWNYSIHQSDFRTAP